MPCTSCWTTFQDALLQCVGGTGLAAYVPVLVVLVKFRRVAFKRPFFTFCITLGFVEIAGLVITGVIAPAVTTYMRVNVDGRVFQRVYGAFSRVPWYAILGHQTYIAVERVTALLHPKLHSRLWTSKAMCFHYCVIVAFSLASNMCIATSACPYVLYDDGATLFYNLSIRGALLHNQIVDLGIQPCFFAAIVLMYLVAGVKVIKMRRQIRASMGQTKNDGTNRRSRMQIMLVLQGFLISAPQIITMILYHILIYLPLPNELQVVVSFVCSVFSKLVYSASPFMYLALNTDIRMKVATMLVGKSGSVSAGVTRTVAAVTLK